MYKTKDKEARKNGRCEQLLSGCRLDIGYRIERLG